MSFFPVYHLYRLIQRYWETMAASGGKHYATENGYLKMLPPWHLMREGPRKALWIVVYLLHFLWNCAITNLTKCWRQPFKKPKHPFRSSIYCHASIKVFLHLFIVCDEKLALYDRDVHSDEEVVNQWHNWQSLNQIITSPVGWGCRIYRLHLCRRVRHPLTNVLDMTLNHLIVRLQLSRFGECGVLFHCHCSQVYPDPEWLHLIGFYLWVK